MSFNDALAQSAGWDSLEQSYGQAEVSGGGEFKPLPTGKYQAEIVESMFDLKKMCMVRKFKIINGGEHTGKSQKDWIYLFKNDGFPNDISASRLKGEIQAFDSDLVALPLKDSLPTYCQGVQGLMADIYISTKPGTDKQGNTIENSTIYINGFIQMHDPSQSPF